MALDIKEIIVQTFLDMCEKKDLRKITVTELLDKTGIGRQTFYNHFKDKDDLIQYCYDTRIQVTWYPNDFAEGDYLASKVYELMVLSFQRMIEYKRFIKPACLISGTNSLPEHMYRRNFKSDYDWHKRMCKGEFTEQIKKSSNYHSAARTRMTIEWILNDFPETAEEMVNEVLRNRAYSLSELLVGNVNGDRYYEQMKKEMHSDNA